jgi:hypothetical protein
MGYIARLTPTAMPAFSPQERLSQAGKNQLSAAQPGKMNRKQVINESPIQNKPSPAMPKRASPASYPRLKASCESWGRSFR